MIKKQTNKTSQKSKSKKRKLPQHDKGTYEKPRADIIFNEEKLKAFS